MAEEKWDLNSKIYDWFDSVLSDDNILKRDFLTDLSHSATFADVIIGVAKDCNRLTDYLCGSESLFASETGKTPLLEKIAELTGVSLDSAYCLSPGYIDLTDEGVRRMVAAAKAAKTAEELRGMVGKTVNGDFTIVAVEEPEKMKATYVRPVQKASNPADMAAAAKKAAATKLSGDGSGGGKHI